MSIVALIPARGGSKRIPRKNVRDLAGHPLLAYSIAAARESCVFDDVVVSSDDPAILSTAMLDYGASIIHCPTTIAHGNNDPDILWVRHALETLGSRYQAFAILRPTSPFRSAATIRRAYQRFSDVGGDCHSLRAVEPARQHPYKMWTIAEGSTSPTLWMHPIPGTPVLRDDIQDVRADGRDFLWSRPTQTLPHVYAQNASLEIAWSANVEQRSSISGTRIIPFFTEGYEGVDINQPIDFLWAEFLVGSGYAELPVVSKRALLEVAQ